MGISIVVPFYQDELYIDECIDSILSAIKTFENLIKDLFQFEIIICDDCSPNQESAIQILQKQANKDPRIQFIKREENGGLAACRNSAIKKTNYKYIMPIDADDKIADSYFIEVYEFIKNNIDLIYTDTQHFGEKFNFVKNEWVPLSRYFPQQDLNLRTIINIWNNHPCSSCIVYKRDLWELVGGYDESMWKRGWVAGEDWCFLIALVSENITWEHIKKPLFYYRKKRTRSLLTEGLSKKDEYVSYMRNKYINKINKIIELKRQENTSKK